MLAGFFNIPWFAWAGISLIVALAYSIFWKKERAAEFTGFRFFILRWGHVFVWLLLSLNFILRGLSPSLAPFANSIALAGGLTYILFIMLTFSSKE